MKQALLTTFFFFALMSSLSAKTWVVDNDQDPVQPTPGTLRHVIHEAADGDEIVFEKKIQMITFSQGEIVINKDLYLKGKEVILSGNHSSSLFSVTDNKTCAMEGLILTNGYGKGGAIHLAKGSLIVRHCIFTKNQATSYGGAIHIDYGRLVAEHAIFSQNQAHSDGGAINGEGFIELRYCQFVGNRAEQRGGALSTFSSEIFIDHSTFACNSSMRGGAIFNLLSTKVSIAHSSFIDNQAVKDGGVLFENPFATTVSLDGVTMTGNSAGERGGALFIRNTDLKIADSVIQLNVPDNIYLD